MGNAESVFATLANNESQLASHDQAISQPQQQTGNAENVFGQIAANNGTPPEKAPAGPTMGPQPTTASFHPEDISSDPFTRAGLKIATPFAKKAMDAVEKLREIENFTQEGEKEHPVRAFMGHIANKLEGFLFGNPTHPEAGIGDAKTGMLTNPITASLIPGAEGEPAAAAMLRGGAGAIKEGVSWLTSAGEAGEQGPGLVKQVLKGEKVAQGPAKSAVRATIGAEDDAKLLEGNKTVVDEHLKGIAAKEKAAYQKMDEAAGFDVKAERETLKNDQYKLKQLGNTETDQTAREKLNASIADSQKRIADAEEKMKAAGVDTKEADILHKQRMAGQEFKKTLVQQVSHDGESVNVDGLLNASKKLRFSKFGDRLEQYMGKEGADKYMEALEQAQKDGVHALKTQAIAKTLGKLGIGALGAGAAQQTIKHFLP